MESERLLSRPPTRLRLLLGTLLLLLLWGTLLLQLRPLRTALAKPGTPLQLGVRSRRVDSAVTKMPFVPSNYYHLK